MQAGYTALRASLAAGDWLTSGKPMEITLSTTTLDGEPQRAEGGLKIYRLKQPEKVDRPDILGAAAGSPAGVARRVPERQEPRSRNRRRSRMPPNPNTWELGEVVAEQGLTTDAAGRAAWSTKLDAGAYRAKFETQDRFGKKIVALLPLNVLAPEAKTFPIKIPNLVAGPKWSLEPGEEFMALWGSGYDRARAFIEIEHRGKLLQGFWTEPGATQQPVKQAVTEAMRGGFTLRVTMVRENRGYLESRYVDVPWSNKNLTVKWEHFVSKLEPGQKETWTAVITGPDAKKAVAEMVAALYDQSLDAYLPHNWPTGFGVFRQDWSRLNWQFENMGKYLNQLQGGWPLDQRNVQITYRRLPSSITVDLWGYAYFGAMAKGEGRMMLHGERCDACRGRCPLLARRGAAMEFADRKSDGVSENLDKSAGDAMAWLRTSREPQNASRRSSQPAGIRPGGQPGPGPDLSQVAARKNLNETAFFFPHLLSDAEGKVKLEFTMPEALTKWKFLGFAHDAELRGGLLTDEAVTAKDLMVQPNPPRFLREGDELEFTVKVTNQSATRQSGKVRLSFANARTAKSIDASLGNTAADQSFELAAKESQSFSWRLTVPDMSGGAISYKAVGSTGRISDGEEGLLPVLVRRTLVTESLPLPIRGPQTKEFKFDRLLKSGESKTLQSQSLTVQMVSNPSWYAVMALPYLMEYPVRVLRADVQSPVCQRPGPAHCQQRSEDPSRLRAVARHTRPGQPAGEEPGPQVGPAGGNALGPPGPVREPGPAERGHPLRRQPAERRDGPGAEETGRRPVPERGLAVVPRRPAERLHHALHHHRFRPHAAPGREARHAAGLQVAGPAGWLDRRDLPRNPPPGPQGRQSPQPDDRAVPLRPQLLPGRPADRARRPRKRSITSSARPASIGCRWPTASRRPTWPWP